MHKISVIIPAHNAEKTIARALASLISNRDYIEDVVLVNDGSTDQTLARASEFLGHLNLIIIDTWRDATGPGNARKVGLEHAGGEWVTFLDADDCLTPSSLRYVSEWWLDDDRLALLCCKTIYYESGSFVEDNINYSDHSCGGNIYRKSYLVENNLIPQEYPRLCEDEFFNQVVISYLNRDEDYNIDHYNYPVYEVHHDTDDGLSYAARNWRDYVIKCRLQGARMLADYFPAYDLREDYMTTVAFSYMLFQGLMQDGDFELSQDDYTDIYADFRAAFEYYEWRFGRSRDEIAKYYEDRWDDMAAGAYDTTGFEFDEVFNMKEFFNMLDGRVE